MDTRPTEFGAHVSNSSLLIHEEAQQCIEYKSAVAMAAPTVPCLLILVGDSKQAPGGVDNTNRDAVRLRTDLMQLPIGLKADNRPYTPRTFFCAVIQLISFARGLEYEDLVSHGGVVVGKSVFRILAEIANG